MRLNPILEAFFKTPSRIKLLKGGRGSGKTTDATAIVVEMSAILKLRVMCARQFMSSLSNSLKPEIEARITEMGLDDEFDIQKTTIIHNTTGSQFLFAGVARNIQEIKGTKGISIMLIEEAQALQKEQFELIMPTLRTEGSECWILWNPYAAMDFVNQLAMNPPDDTLVLHINFDQNPFLPTVLKKQIESDRKRLPPEEFAHIWYGVPLSDEALSFIKPSWLRACIDAHIALNRPGIAKGARRLGLDLADAGADTSATALAVGNFLQRVGEWKSTEDKLLESVQIAYGQALEDDATLVPDVIGVGASAVAKVIEMNELRTREGLAGVEYGKFHAGEAAPEVEYQPEINFNDHFTNLKAAAWGTLSDRARNTFVLRTAIEAGKTGDDLPNFSDGELLSISSEIGCLEKLITELSSPRKVIDLAGRTMVEKKSDMAKRGIPSPNLADATVIALWHAPESIGFFG